jgi:hypothetical protein
VEHGLEYALSAAEQAAGKGAEYSRQLNPFYRELKRRFFGILWLLEAIYGRNKDSRRGINGKQSRKTVETYVPWGMERGLETSLRRNSDWSHFVAQILEESFEGISFIGLDKMI